MPTRFIASLIFGCSVSLAQAAEVSPTSYTIDQATDTGSYSYHDWTGTQLTDGEYGTAPWHADLGNGNAYEWLGWLHDPVVNIVFDLGSNTSPINRVVYGTVQDHLNDVVIPDSELFSSTDGVSWTSLGSISVPESNAFNNTYQSYTYDNLNIVDQFVRLTVSHSFNGPWTFIDEVDFFSDAQVNPVPLPPAGVLLLVGLATLRLSKKRLS